MITSTRRVSPDKSEVRIAFSLDNTPVDKADSERRLNHDRFSSVRPDQVASPVSKEGVDRTSILRDVKDVEDLSQTFPDLEQRLQPVPPCVALRESVQVYREHCKMAREFHQVKHEIAVLEDRRRKLLAELVEDEKVAVEIARLEEEFRLLTEENHTLASAHSERAQQLETLCRTGPTGPGDC